MLSASVLPVRAPGSRDVLRLVFVLLQLSNKTAVGRSDVFVQKVAWVRRRLMENGKIARATHNVAAWRVWDELRGVQLHDNDDDGKRAFFSTLRASVHSQPLA